MQLRQWQKNCLEAFLSHRKETGSNLFVFEACPGAGKSYMAAEMSWQMLMDNGEGENRLFDIDFVLVLVPWTSIQGDTHSGMIKTFGRRGLDVRDRLFIKSNRIVEQPVPSALNGVVTTYAEGATAEAVDLLRMWTRKGLRFALILDEVHHTSERSDSKWGDNAEELSRMAGMTIVMSGTFFRGDQQPIRIVQYKDPPKHDEVDTNFSYPYSLGVENRDVRPVGFRCMDADVHLYDKRKDERVTRALSSIVPSDQKYLSAAGRELFHPDGEFVRDMIMEAHEDMLRTRERFRDAGFLYSTRPGKDNRSGNKYVYDIASKIRQYTGEQPEIVTYDDRNALGKIDRFRNGDQMYLVAVNMISEGVDIPRLRGLGMLRYIQKETQFRQLVGRVIRMTDDEDPTFGAAHVFMPKFQRMHQFGENMERESLDGLKNLACEDCGEYPCVCPCDECKQSPCVCIKGPNSPEIRDPDVEAIGIDVLRGGGVISGKSILERYIQAALVQIASERDIRHADKVQLGRTLQSFDLGRGSHQEDRESPVEQRQRIRSKVNRAMQRLCGLRYAGDFAQCWYENLLEPYGVDWQTALNSWPLPRLAAFLKEIEDKIAEAYRNR